MESTKLPFYPFLLYMTYFLYTYIAYQMLQNCAGTYLPDYFGATLPDKELNLWLMMSICMSIGYFLPKKVSANTAIIISLFILPLSILMPPLFIISTIIFLLNVGILGSIIHYEILCKVSEKWRGRCVGFALAVAVLINYIFRDLTLNEAIGFIIVNLAALGLILWRCRKENKIDLDAALDFDNSVQNSNTKSVITIIILVISISVLLGLMDGAEFHFYNGEINIYFGEIRLTYMLALIFAGCIADFKSRKYLLPITVILLIVRIIGLNIFTMADMYIFNIVMNNYFCGAFTIITLTTCFLDFAAKTNNPMFWAGMGRAIQLPMSAIASIVGAYLWQNISWNAFVTTYIIILVIPLVISYQWRWNSKEIIISEMQPINPIQSTEPIEEITSIEPIQNIEQIEPSIPNYKSQFAFTEREKDIVEAILSGLTINEMALKYAIKERTVKYHISNILRKTNTRNQKELLILLNKI